MSNNEEVSESIRPLLGLCREHIDRSDQAGHQLLRAVQRREEFGRQGDAHADLQAAEQAYPTGSGRGGQTGTAIQRGTGVALRKRTTTRERQPGHAGGGKKNGSVDAGCRKTQHGLLARGRVQTNRGSVKTFLRREKHQDQSMRRLPGPADERLSDGDQTPEAHFGCSGLAENTNSIFGDGSSGARNCTNGCLVLQGCRNPQPRGTC